MTEPRVAIIILNWNGLEDTTECLESLQKVSYPNYEVVVVDNGSAGDEARTLRERFGEYIHLVENDRNEGFAEGNNIGMRYALDDLDPDYLLLLNNDTTVAPEFLDELVQAAEAGGRARLLGPKILFYSEPDRIQSAGAKINRWTANSSHVGGHELNTEQFEDLAEVDFVSGCCLLIPRGVIELIGMLDPVYFVGYEDSDYCMRAAKAGVPSVCCRRARIWHKASAARHKSTKFRVYYHPRNQFIFARRHLSKLQVATAMSFFVLHWPKYFVEYVRYHRDMKTLKDFGHALVDIVRGDRDPRGEKSPRK